MRGIVLLLLATSLTACGCVLDKGDSAAAGSYWDGCWAAAKKQK